MHTLARRFLHVNLNCASLQATEALYVGALGLTPRMRTDREVATDGSFLGLAAQTFCATAFMYDARGGRGGCALESIEFLSPPLQRDASVDPVRPGIRSTHLRTADLDAAGAAVRAAGLSVGAPVTGLCSGERSVLIADPDGTIIELSQAPNVQGMSRSALFSGIRIAAIDAVATGEFLRAIGFEEMQAPVAAPVLGEQLAPGGGPTAIECLVGGYGLPEDADHFTLTVVEHPATADEPVPWGGNRQGLYRSALRVDSVQLALAAVPSWVERRGDPVWCPLPGTKIGGLYIAFLRSPDGVVFEFVERPLSFFG